MKTLNLILISSLFLASSLSAWAADSLSNAQNAIDSAKQSLESLEKRGKLQVAPEASAEMSAVYQKLNAALSALQDEQQARAQSPALDGFIAEARLVQKVMSAYFGEKGTFGYRLKQNSISVDIEGGGVWEAVSRRVPFLRNVGASGRVVFRSTDEAVTQFNSLKAEFYGLLVEAAHISPQDSRVKNLADWGNDTQVIYPRETFGTPILTSQEVWNLR